jgi:hypothetical protein
VRLAALALLLASCDLPVGEDVTDQVAPLIETAYGLYAGGYEQAASLPRPRVILATHDSGCPGQQFEYDGRCVTGVTTPGPVVFVAVPDEGPALWSRSFLAEGLLRATGVTSWTVDDPATSDLELARYWFSVSTIDDMGGSR